MTFLHWLDPTTGKCDSDNSMSTVPSVFPEGKHLYLYERMYGTLDLGAGFAGKLRTATFSVEDFRTDQRPSYMVTLDAGTPEDFRDALDAIRQRLGLEIVDLTPRLVIRLPRWFVRLAQKCHWITIEVVSVPAAVKAATE